MPYDGKSSSAESDTRLVRLIPQQVCRRTVPIFFFYFHQEQISCRRVLPSPPTRRRNRASLPPRASLEIRKKLSDAQESCGYDLVHKWRDIERQVEACVIAPLQPKCLQITKFPVTYVTRIESSVQLASENWSDPHSVTWKVPSHCPSACIVPSLYLTNQVSPLAE